MVALVALAVAFPLLWKWQTTCSVLLSFLHPCAPFCLARLRRGSRGCSPHSSTASRRPHVWVRCHTRTHRASLHHVMCLFHTSFPSCIEFPSFLSSTHSCLRCHLLFFSVPFVGLNSSFLSFSFSRLTFSLALSLHSFLSIFLSHCFPLLFLLSPCFSLFAPSLLSPFS